MIENEKRNLLHSITEDEFKEVMFKAIASAIALPDGIPIATELMAQIRFLNEVKCEGLAVDYFEDEYGIVTYCIHKKPRMGYGEK